MRKIKNVLLRASTILPSLYGFSYPLELQQISRSHILTNAGHESDVVRLLDEDPTSRNPKSSLITDIGILNPMHEHLSAFLSISLSSDGFPSHILAIEQEIQEVPKWTGPLRSLRFDDDEVVRVMDANTVKLKRAGLVKFAAVQTPSGYKDDFRFPDCMNRSPAYLAKNLLPSGTKVKVRLMDEASLPKALIQLRDGNGRGASSGKLVNFELVKEGFARPSISRRGAFDEILPGFLEDLALAQKEAQNLGLGMYKLCSPEFSGDVSNLNIGAAGWTLADLDDQFEPLDFTTEIHYGDDGGLVKLRAKDDTGPKAPPRNPVSPDNPLPLSYIRKCADFNTYEDALRWYEKYYPFYGDVAKLDRDGDGVPCSGLPHTTNQGRYRMKKPTMDK